ncbi:MAG: hypothetical protein IKF00_11630 [Solobacterium sp.]|nr:hypothetical protein [Solobacterium sp.]
MTIELDLIQTTGLSVLIYMLGRWIKTKVSFFRKYFIPAPVIGGLICSLLIFFGHPTLLPTCPQSLRRTVRHRPHGSFCLLLPSSSSTSATRSSLHSSSIC